MDRANPVCKNLHMSITQLPSGHFRLQIRRKNLQHDEVYKTHEEAELKRDALLGKLKSDGITLTEVWELYKESMSFKQKAEQTQKTEQSRIKHVLKRLGHYTPRQLEERDELIYEYQDSRANDKVEKTGKKVGATSIRLEIAALSAVMEYAKKHKHVKSNFVSKIERPGLSTRSRRVPRQEQGKLSLHVGDPDPVVAKASRFNMLLRHLGCRPGELSKLRKKDLRMQDSEVLFRNTKDKKRDRMVHASTEARRLINLQLDGEDKDCPFLFGTWSAKDQEWKEYNYSWGVKELRKKGIVGKDFHPHAGRREFISRAIEGAVPLTTLKKQTGHKSTQALELYDQGLSNAPDVREIFEHLGNKVTTELLLGMAEALKASDEDKEKLLKILGKSKWKQPFKN